jgi:hypothetical protein
MVACLPPLPRNCERNCVQLVALTCGRTLRTHDARAGRDVFREHPHGDAPRPHPHTPARCAHACWLLLLLLIGGRPGGKAGAARRGRPPGGEPLTRVRVEIMGSQQCRIAGKSQSVAIMINHGGTVSTRHAAASVQVAGLVLHWLRVRGLARLAPSQHALLCALGQPALPESKVAARAARVLRALRGGDSVPSVASTSGHSGAAAPHGAVTGAVLDALRRLLGRLCLAAQMSGAQIGAAMAAGIVRRSSLAEQLEHAKTDGALTCMAYYDSLSTVAHLRRLQPAPYTQH